MTTTMNRSHIGRVQQAARMPMPGTTRIATGTTPMAGRGQFRGAGAGLLSRGTAAAPTRQRSSDSEDTDEKDPKKVKTDDETDPLECTCDPNDPTCDCHTGEHDDDAADPDKKKEPLFAK
ncbi:MAG: hypothetical protein ACREQ5_08635 [Candidatus Dormibacteria bacterium]